MHSKSKRIPALAVLGLALSLVARADAQVDELDPAEVRAHALARGLASLETLEVPTSRDLKKYLRSGSDARRALVQLGKALFWDMQVGSDGQACASCHFHAGADSRTKNQLRPGGTDDRFAPTATGEVGPNLDLVADDFPFHQLEDQQDRTSPVLHDTDDVCSSQGVFSTEFDKVVKGKASERGNPVADPIFQVGGVNVRRVTSRNAPSTINAAFNRLNFWDGRAHDVFNGVNGLGLLDPGATVLVVERGKLVPATVRLEAGSLASQAVVPPGSDTEMAFAGRTFPDLGRKLLALRPLGQQLVHPKDGVLGSLSRAKVDKHGRFTGKPGLSVGSYADLIKKAFAREYWESSKKVDGYTQTERNFSLFFGIAIQAYESTLVSDRTPFDEFMAGDDTKLTQEQLRGLLVFIKDDDATDAIFARVGQGNCVACHGGPALTHAAGPGSILVAPAPLLVADTLVLGPDTAFLDAGFSNIGVRPTAEDLGRGGMVSGIPLSSVRQRLAGLPSAPALPACGGIDQHPCPDGNRVAVDGAFKIPGLRNVELTGPYFHNGGQATLRQTVIFYERLGDFSNDNVIDVDPDLVRIALVERDEQPLVEFMRSLTDERVRWERKPFDHPQLFVPNGHAGDHSVLDCVKGIQACDDLREIPAIGDGGRPAALGPLGTFLGLDPLAK